jgi:hypothetical protein
MEPDGSLPNWAYHAVSVAGVLCLVGLYFFGVWSRSYIMPSANDLPIAKQLVAAIPVGLMTMGIYAKSAFAQLSDDNLAFDGPVIVGYAIIFGMLSRETLERLLTSVAPPTALGAGRTSTREVQ